MGLVKCKECGKEISKKAKKCPNCGIPIKRKQYGCLTGILIIFFGMIIVGIISSSIPKHSKEKMAGPKKQNTIQLQNLEKEKTQKEMDDFINDIEKHYQKFDLLFKDNKLKKTVLEGDKFKRFKQLNYKDIGEKYKKAKIALLKQEVKKIPASEFESNLKIYKQLADLDPGNKKYTEKITYYNIKYTEEKQRSNSDLELLSWNWKENYGYAIAEGEVKNISGIKLNNVIAVVTWYDSSGQLITSDSALIEFNPIMPGQTSPFKVMQNYNPAMNGARVTFKYLMGRNIPTFREK